MSDHDDIDSIRGIIDTVDHSPVTDSVTEITCPFTLESDGDSTTSYITSRLCAS